MLEHQGLGRLAGKVAIVTGSASGIGQAATALFAAEGARVMAVDILDEPGRRGVEAVARGGGEATFVRADVTREQDVIDAVRQAETVYGPVDVLYNCAGGSAADDAAAHELDLATVHRVFSLELDSVLMFSRAVLPGMIERRSGAIINMTSFVAFRGVFEIHAYTAAKGAVAALTRTMAGTYAQHGIRVNAIAPGTALSDRAAARIQDPNIAATMTFSWDDYPFGVGRPIDIANVALFLASDESRMINAQTIMADGGLSAY